MDPEERREVELALETIRNRRDLMSSQGRHVDAGYMAFAWQFIRALLTKQDALVAKLGEGKPPEAPSEATPDAQSP